ncbi:hypothetical protein GCWU000321_00378 [Dialister invisus DSM 15470]|uniref:Uncharacterized protein n=1 Tax=Dialister invisus DSM 15470 TaxID=592028 RepID=C9LRA4_9FIRM|nr:hypothetical protein GCWU000321_00378 [Dialister invisus DSM 15470]
MSLKRNIASCSYAFHRIIFFYLYYHIAEITDGFILLFSIFQLEKIFLAPFSETLYLTKEKPASLH